MHFGTTPRTMASSPEREASIVSTSIPNDGGIRYSSIESINLRCVGVSKLWHLDLNRSSAPSWENIGLHTTRVIRMS